ncbi:SDR family oxidoreductase [Cohnella zeiphila]|uniref:SDR family oxidoreductase n=1 Tax=Cohnella zeiphila TaxID=2761120 RepID=A0A7X0SJB5_9BACL|nr:SDR family oxidoreductase [Cohnella zeiphila]MBB6731007.1 SDR family oxidoreductase [Cohnella zeiphila]
MNLLITGANRGLGFWLAVRAAERGCTVYAGVRNAVSPNPGLIALSERFPGKVLIRQLDITNDRDAEQLAESLREENARLDALINNAAILLGRADGIDTLKPADVAASFQVNVVGQIRVVQHLLPFLGGESGGQIVNVSSGSGSFHHARGGDYPYGMSKAALNMFTKQLHLQLQDRGVHVWAVHPGWMQTDMGGPQAPDDPARNADLLLDLIDGTRPLPRERFYVDLDGADMPL